MHTTFFILADEFFHPSINSFESLRWIQKMRLFQAIDFCKPYQVALSKVFFLLEVYTLETEALTNFFNIVIRQR